ncbi:hypothetical protein T492DRAFT_853277 [Pavlovales sp. CCMP2436]|nr:hypothetical protein T492DRAFT_853277 [Pavlovales sp. CCMP2436]
MGSTDNMPGRKLRPSPHFSKAFYPRCAVTLQRAYAAVLTLMRQPRAAAARQRESVYSSESLSAHCGLFPSQSLYSESFIGPIEAKLNTVKPIRGIVIGAFGEVSADTHSLVEEIAAQGGRKMYALMGVSPMEAAARIKKQLIDTIGTIAARGHAQLLLARLSALAPIAAQRGNTTNSNQQIISLNALARAHYRRSISTRGGAQASAAD